MHALDCHSQSEVFFYLSVLNRIKVTLVTLAQRANADVLRNLGRCHECGCVSAECPEKFGTEEDGSHGR